ncbi:MAG TPA: O-methyltransferase [Thermoplasmata archaeon]|nr:O-methyltransferase [Thermoplasmata archaeon]
MTDLPWEAVDAYFESKLLAPDPALEECLRASAAAGLPSIQVSPVQGRLLHLIAKLSGARRILEIGTLGGYSTICLARALPENGELVTLEIDPKHAEVARANVARAGLTDRVDVRVGPALDSLPELEKEKRGPFDLFFLDADRPNNRAYLEWALRLGHPGSVLVVDNVVRRGSVADSSSPDPSVKGVREMIDALASERRIRATAIQTVGKKGYDGFLLARID